MFPRHRCYCGIDIMNGASTHIVFFCLLTSSTVQSDELRLSAIDAVPSCVQINERSSVLRCSLGTTLARMGDAGGAIKGLQAAIRADQANPLARFELAGVLLGQERFQEALQELTYLRVGALGLPSRPLLWIPFTCYLPIHEGLQLHPQQLLLLSLAWLASSHYIIPWYSHLRADPRFRLRHTEQRSAYGIPTLRGYADFGPNTAVQNCLPVLKWGHCFILKRGCLSQAVTFQMEDNTRHAAAATPA